MDPEQLAKAILSRDENITLLSYQLQDHLSKLTALEYEFERLKKENADLLKKLEKKSVMVLQEMADVQLIKKKIKNIQAKSWGETFLGVKSWISSKIRREKKNLPEDMPK